MTLTMTIRISSGRRTAPKLSIEGNSVNNRTIPIPNGNDIKESELANAMRDYGQAVLNNRNY